MFTHIRRLDWTLAGSALLLSGLGLVSLYSSSLGLGDFGNFQKQGIFLVVGVILMIVFSLVDWRLLKNDPFFIFFLYVFALVALGGLLIFAPEIRGVQGWYRIGGVSIDPVEYTKLILIIAMAKYFSFRHMEIYRIRHILVSGAYFGIPIGLIFLQPDLGSAILLAFLWGVLLIVAGIRLRHLLALLGIGVLLLAVGWTTMLQDYQKDRIFAFLEPELDPLGIGWNQMQAEIAIGNGGLWGRGIGGGTQTQYGFLPEPQTDFIFAAFAEEFGLVGIFLLVGLFLFFVRRVLRIGLAAHRNFPRLFAAGFATLLIAQFFVNIGMNLGFLPIIGLSLPLVSYGGSSLLMTYAALGILQSIRSH
ncbi:rod shape-determining protein RodA [Patescibacteria group bacterium]|nr:rod shape-determining protein RodA [Patescibacteria group bacterium]